MTIAQQCEIYRQETLRWQEAHADLKAKLSQVEAQWTNSPPTVPGWYWHHPSRSRFRSIVWVSETHIKAVTFFKDDKWCGPIPEPQEPTPK